MRMQPEETAFRYSSARSCHGFGKACRGCPGRDRSRERQADCRRPAASRWPISRPAHRAAASPWAGSSAAIQPCGRCGQSHSSRSLHVRRRPRSGRRCRFPAPSKDAAIRIDHDRAGQLGALIGNALTQEARLDLLIGNRWHRISLVGLLGVVVGNVKDIAFGIAGQRITSLVRRHRHAAGRSAGMQPPSLIETRPRAAPASSRRRSFIIVGLRGSGRMKPHHGRSVESGR